MITVDDGDVEVIRGEDECPQCKSQNIIGEQFSVDGGVAQQDCYCSECFCEWTLLFNLSTLVVNKNGKNAPINYLYRSANHDVGDACDTYEIYKIYEDDDEDVIAHVQTEALAIKMTDILNNKAP